MLHSLSAEDIRTSLSTPKTNVEKCQRHSEIAYESTRKGILHTYASMLRDTDLVAYAILSSVPVTMVKKPENDVVHNI